MLLPASPLVTLWLLSQFASLQYMFGTEMVGACVGTGKELRVLCYSSSWLYIFHTISGLDDARDS